SFKRGISTYPLPRQNVHLLTRDEVDAIYAAAEGKGDNGCDHLVQFAHYIGSNNAICRANVDKMFGMHCAILGSTGSGKSGAVAALIHSILDHEPIVSKKAHPRIVIIDPHGEYGK